MVEKILREKTGGGGGGGGNREEFFFFFDTEIREFSFISASFHQSNNLFLLKKSWEIGGACLKL